jgi:hypothetical protein
LNKGSAINAISMGNASGVLITAKLKGILDWPAPKTVKEVQSFLGFGNFYCHFVKGFSHLAHPLNDLLKKDKKFVWSKECQESFDQLKK